MEEKLYDLIKESTGKGAGEIGVYLFRADDGLSPDERICRAVEEYFKFDCCACKNLLQVKKTERGKPYFSELPAFHLSISHSGEYWVCALATGNVGVDIQKHDLRQNETMQDGQKRLCKLAHRFFHPAEVTFLESECFLRFFGIWAARESYVKYTGQGIDASFSEICVLPEKSGWPKLEAKLKELREIPASETGVKGPATWFAQGGWFAESQFNGNYTLCVCAGREYPVRFVKCF